MRRIASVFLNMDRFPLSNRIMGSVRVHIYFVLTCALVLGACIHIDGKYAMLEFKYESLPSFYLFLWMDHASIKVLLLMISVLTLEEGTQTMVNGFTLI